LEANQPYDLIFRFIGISGHNIYETKRSKHSFEQYLQVKEGPIKFIFDEISNNALLDMIFLITL
jgi:hypothetical protein